MKKICNYGIPLLLGICLGYTGRCQPTITGPTCVIPGTVYQYLFKGQWRDSSTMQVCLNGAVIADVKGPCSGDVSPFSYLLVTWNTGVTDGVINLTSSAGNSSLAVAVTQPLQAGSILAASRIQTVNFNGVPAMIRCGADVGGSCKPVYTHQWQQSQDGVNWTDIPGATGDDLRSIPTFRLTRYFRRKTVETVSGTIAFSDAAAMLAGPPPPGYKFSITDSNLQ